MTNQTSDLDRPLVLLLSPAGGAAAFGLRPAYEILNAVDDESACQLLRTHGDRLAAVAIDVDHSERPLDALLLPRVLRRNTPLPPHLQDLPPVQVPIILVSSRALSDAERRHGDRLVERPVQLGAFTLALTDWRMRR